MHAGRLFLAGLFVASTVALTAGPSGGGQPTTSVPTTEPTTTTTEAPAASLSVEVGPALADAGDGGCGVDPVDEVVADPFTLCVVVTNTGETFLSFVRDRKSTRLNSSHLGISYA